MGLAEGLVMEVGTPREDPGPSALVWSPWPGGQGCRGHLLLTAAAKSLRDLQILGNPHHKPSCATGVSRTLRIIFHFLVFSPNWVSTLGKTDRSKSALT